MKNKYCRTSSPRGFKHKRLDKKPKQAQTNDIGLDPKFNVGAAEDMDLAIFLCLLEEWLLGGKKRLLVLAICNEYSVGYLNSFPYFCVIYLFVLILYLIEFIFRTKAPESIRPISSLNIY